MGVYDPHVWTQSHEKFGGGAESQLLHVRKGEGLGVKMVAKAFYQAGGVLLWDREDKGLEVGEMREGAS